MDEARIADRLKRLGPQRQALQITVRPFADARGRFDSARWERGFASADPEVIAQVANVTGMYEKLVNHLIEMLHAGGRLAGLDACRGATKPSGPVLVNAVKDDGGLTAGQAETLLRLNQTRNALQHNSPGVQADQVHADVELLYKTLGRFVTSYMRWLERHDIHILPTAPAKDP